MVPLPKSFQRHGHDASRPASKSRAGTAQGLRIIAAGLAALILAGPGPAAQAPPAVDVSGTAVRVDGRPTFLLGASLFDALGPVPPRDSDLEALVGWGVGLVRVWAHWTEPIYQRDGALTPVGRRRLLALVERLGTRKLLLELVLLRPGQLPGQGSTAFASPEARLRAVREITSALRSFHNVLFDLYNEHDHPGGPISHADARAIRDAVKAVDPNRVVTISSTEYHLVAPTGRVGDNELRNLREEALNLEGSVGVDVVAVHLPRTGDWAAATGSRVGVLRAALDRLGVSIPLYLNEERRAVPGTPLPSGDYQQAVSIARRAGAAGWVFHTAAGYDLSARPFGDALGAEERLALTKLKPAAQ